MSSLARILAALSLALGFSATPAEASLKAMWGPSKMPDGSSAFPVYKQLGVRVLQHQLSWRDVATRRPANAKDPNDPAYVWPAALDQAVAEGDQNGIRSAIMVKRTPDWANGNRGEQWVPTRLRDYADFMIAAGDRHVDLVGARDARRLNERLQAVCEPEGPGVEHTQGRALSGL